MPGRGARLILLLLASDACYALSRNDRLSEVLWNRVPGSGPWLEALLLAAGSALPRLRCARRRQGLARWLAVRALTPARPA